MENIPVKQSKRRQASIDRETNETNIRVELNLDGSGKADVNTGIPFFDHMLTLFAVHGFFDLFIFGNSSINLNNSSGDQELNKSFQANRNSLSSLLPIY